MIKLAIDVEMCAATLADRLTEADGSRGIARAARPRGSQAALRAKSTPSPVAVNGAAWRIEGQAEGMTRCGCS
jgi:hypothetical protein